MKTEVAEFSRLVNEIRGDCDKCKQDCRHRLLILDSIIEEFKALERRLNERMAIMDELGSKLGALLRIDSTVLRLIDTGESNEADRTVRRLFVE